MEQVNYGWLPGENGLERRSRIISEQRKAELGTVEARRTSREEEFRMATNQARIQEIHRACVRLGKLWEKQPNLTLGKLFQQATVPPERVSTDEFLKSLQLEMERPDPPAATGVTEAMAHAHEAAGRDDSQYFTRLVRAEQRAEVAEKKADQVSAQLAILRGDMQLMRLSLARTGEQLVRRFGSEVPADVVAGD